MNELSARIENEFTYHKPTGLQKDRLITIRDKAKELALTISVKCPESRERCRAITKIREAVMWANAAIACNEVDVPTDETSKEGE